MKIVVYFMEPAKYSVMLGKYLEEAFAAECHYFQSASKANSVVRSTSLRSVPIFKRWKQYFDQWMSADLILSNGYQNDFFLIPFLLNHVAKRKVSIAICSDTQFSNRIGIVGWLKNVLLSYIFTKRYIFGFAGGSQTHMNYFKKHGMEDRRIKLFPMVSSNYDFSLLDKPHDKQFVFLYVGRFIERKNIDYALREFLSIVDACPLASFVLVGDGLTKAELLAEYQGRDEIIFSPPLFGDELANVFSQSQVLVLPSFDEPWGLVINEALSAGLPVIVNKEVGARYDLVDGKQTGLVIDATIKGALAESMIKLYNDKDLYQTMSRNAVQLMKAQWNLDFVGRCLKDAIKSIEND